MFATTQLITLGLAALSSAAVLPRASDPDCRTKFAGVLSATVVDGDTTTYKSFTLTSLNHTAYLGDGESPLVVQMQECASLNEGEGSTDRGFFGRLYVPSKGHCIGITNQAKSTGPYYTTLVKCGTSVAQRFGYEYDNDAIYWTGASDEEGTVMQGGCGALGYKSATDGVPTITHTDNQITLECNSTTPLRLSLSAN